MLTVLGIDAAWTAANPSGVALVAGMPGSSWRCIKVAPSYAAFMADGPVDWTAKVKGGIPSVRDFLARAAELAGQRIELVTIDMPVATDKFEDRRHADNAVTDKFGKHGCGTHSPTKGRPGRLAACLSGGFRDAGYELATAHAECGTLHRLVEVYPHPALLRLLKAEYRVQYKAGKTTTYWSGLDVATRRNKLINVYRDIVGKLGEVIEGIDLPDLRDDTFTTFSALKHYEDALDALVCAWVGIMYLEGRAVPYGDETAAIWVPV